MILKKPVSFTEVFLAVVTLERKLHFCSADLTPSHSYSHKNTVSKAISRFWCAIDRENKFVRRRGFGFWGFGGKVLCPPRASGFVVSLTRCKMALLADRFTCFEAGAV